MPVERRPAGGSAKMPAAPPKPQFHLRLPDVFADEQNPGTSASAKPPERRAAARDPIEAARNKLREKRYLDGHKQVATMIEGLRGKRRKLFKHLWVASVALTALSIVALAVEVLQRADVLSSFGEAIEIENRGDAEISENTRVATNKKQLSKKSAARQWSNALPAEGAVQSAAFESSGPTRHEGAWLEGGITDNDNDSPRRGALHDDHQSRSP